MITGRQSTARTSRPSDGNAEVQDLDKDHRNTARNSPDDVMTVDLMEDGINKIAVGRISGINYQITHDTIWYNN